MWIKPLFTIKSIILSLILTLTLGEIRGQEYPPTDRFLFVALGEEEIPLKRSRDYGMVDLEPLLAIKTNLLYDLLAFVNFEVEIPIERQWSLCTEMVLHWSCDDNEMADSRRNRVQVINGNLEGRYWWGDRELRPTLSGWFTGVYSSIASYDVERHGSGYQGDSLFSVGLTGGYAHSINRQGDLRLEYSLGVGYVGTYYHHYHAEFCSNNHWHAVVEKSGLYRWFGPTRLKVSLSWLIGCKVK